MDRNREPVTYQVIAYNIGVKPAGCIATVALYKSSDMFKDQWQDNSYVDNLGLTGKDKAEIRAHTLEADEILAHAGMTV